MGFAGKEENMKAGGVEFYDGVATPNVGVTDSDLYKTYAAFQAAYVASKQSATPTVSQS